MNLYIVCDEAVYAKATWQRLTTQSRDRANSNAIYNPLLNPSQFGQTWFLIEAQSPEWACAVCDAVCERYFVHPNDKKFRNIKDWLETYKGDPDEMPLAEFIRDIIQEKGESTFGVFQEEKIRKFNPNMEIITKSWNERKVRYGQNYYEYYE